MVTLTSENFESEVINNKSTVLVDFWASWCGPCRMLAPIVDEVAAKHPEITVGKINVDEEPALAAKFNIMTIPTLIVFKNGTARAKPIGLIASDEIENLLAQA